MAASGHWIKIANDIASVRFNEKNLARLEIDGRKICLIKTEQGLRACTDRCPHAGGSLSEGYVDHQQNIVCCVHNYKFNLNTGRDAFNEGYFLKRFPVKVDENGVFIDLS